MSLLKHKLIRSVTPLLWRGTGGEVRINPFSIFFLSVAISFFLYSFTQPSQLNVETIFQKVDANYKSALSKVPSTTSYPRTYSENSVVRVESKDWTSGFFPGCLWYMYEFSKDPAWRKKAEAWTIGLEKEKNNTRTHDLGFILYNSFGNGFRLTQDQHYKEVLLKGAKSLASRYNPTVGCIRSWNHGDWTYPVIVDNMMNLELLFWAAKNSSDKTFYSIAVSHAKATMKNHFRKNGSSYHVVDYNPKTGEVISRTTATGFGDESTWARGQAWGLYGFTMTYRETNDTVFLNHAEKIAHYFIKFLPKNKIPYWDFDAPNIPDELQDASAAAIAASALIELSQYSKKNSALYFKTAEEILKTLSSSAYFSPESTQGNFLIVHGVGHKPKKQEVDVPLIYTDYYFIEAMLRYRATMR